MLRRVRVGVVVLCSGVQITLVALKDIKPGDMLTLASADYEPPEDSDSDSDSASHH
jgi:hypothetical protein